jgi:hypothetical protein
MWELPRWYISACSNSVQYVRLHPILMSILLYHYKQLTACILEVEWMEAKVNNKKKKDLSTAKKEEEEKIARGLARDNWRDEDPQAVF